MNIRGIEMDSIVDGEGIRMTVFFQGCPHHCVGCHNPETWDYNIICNGYTVEELLAIFDSNPILSGITLSGGEPFSPQNLNDISVLCREIKKRNKNIWIFTGYVLNDLVLKYPNIKSDILPFVDVVVDGPFIIENKNLLKRFRGSDNQRLIKVEKFLNGEEHYTFE